MLNRFSRSLLTLSVLTAASLRADSILSSASDSHCPGSTVNEANLAAATGPLPAASLCSYSYSQPDWSESGAGSSSATADYGYLSGSGGITSSLSTQYVWPTSGASVYTRAAYNDSATVTDGPGLGYLRMFYLFSYSGELNPGNNPSQNSLDWLYYLNGSPQQVLVTTAGSWSGSVSGAVDYPISGIHSFPNASIVGQATCAEVGSGACSASINVDWNITGWQVLDNSFQPDVAATVQFASGASYESAPEPGTVGLFGTGAVILLVRIKGTGNRPRQ